MIPRLRVICFAFALAAESVALGGMAAAEDDGRKPPCTVPDRGPSCTILRPPPPPQRVAPLDAPECIVAVGGLGSDNDDFLTPREGDTFGTLLAPFRGDPRYVIHRFGSQLEHPDLFPYKTYGSIDADARALRDFVRSLSSSCRAIHVVAHSMGGDVADRAFSLGLSGADGVQTYLPISTPHNGALIAWLLTRADDMSPAGNEALRTISETLRGMGLQAHDVTSPAVRDLAVITPPLQEPRGVRVVLRQRLPTDEIALFPDTRSRLYPLEERLPAADGDGMEWEGHGHSLTNAEIRDTTVAVIRTGVVPPYAPSRTDRILAFILNVAALVFWGGVFGLLGLSLVGGILMSTSVTQALKALLPDVVQWWIRAFPALEGVVTAIVSGIARVIEGATSFAKGVITRLATELDKLGLTEDNGDEFGARRVVDPRVALVKRALDRAVSVLGAR